MTRSPGADVVVVGGGLVGASLAYELVSAGADTVLVDRHDPGRATDAGAGILSPETNRDPDPEFAAFGLAAARHYQSLASRLADDGVTEVGYQVTGSLLVAERPGDDAFMDEAVRLVEDRCPGLAEEVDPGDVSRFFPPLGPVRRALLNPAARRVDGRMLNTALLRAAASRGLRAVATAVTGLDLDRKSGTARGVVTAEGTVAAGAVVIAGGAWSAEMADALGVSVPVAPLKGQIVHLTLPATDSSHWTIVQPVLGFYLVPWPDGRVACGGTMEAGAGFDNRPTADGLHQLLPRMPPHRAGVGPRHAWRGPGGIASGDTGRSPGHRAGPRLGECPCGHRSRSRGAPPRSLQRAGGRSSAARAGELRRSHRAGGGDACPRGIFIRAVLRPGVSVPRAFLELSQRRRALR